MSAENKGPRKSEDFLGYVGCVRLYHTTAIIPYRWIWDNIKPVTIVMLKLSPGQYRDNGV